MSTYAKTEDGRNMKRVNLEAKLIVLYVSNLILFGKKGDAIHTVDQYGKYFYDRDLCEANLRKLRGLALIRRRKEDVWENSLKAVKEFVKANIIFQQLNCSSG